MLEIALDKPEYRPGDTMTVAVTARTAGRVTLNVIGDRLLELGHAGRAARHRAAFRQRRQRLGHRRLCGCDAAPSARCPGAAHARPRDRRAVVLRSTARRTRWRSIMKLPPLQRPNSTLRIPIKIAGLAAGEEARIVVAAVDVGILNLTNYKPPAPGRLLSRPAAADRRNPRSLRPAHRRHAGHARPDPHRRR